MKQCTVCGDVKPLEDFHVNRKSKTGRAASCKICKRKTDNALYANKEGRKEYIRETNLRGIKERKLFIRSYFLDHPCVDCGETDPIVLEFDHVKGEKFAGVGRMVTANMSFTAIKAEIDKCEVRCCNCHRRITAKRGNWNLCLVDDNGSMTLS